MCSDVTRYFETKLLNSNNIYNLTQLCYGVYQLYSNYKHIYMCQYIWESARAEAHTEQFYYIKNA